DALGSVAAMIAGIVILTTGWVLIDPILSFVIAAILLWGGWRLIHETSLELMEASPTDLDMKCLKVAMTDVDGVVDVHHIHLWRLPSNQLAISAHIRLDDMNAWVNILPKLISVLKNYDVEHVTLQAETDCYDA
ncbi:MAG: cation diffusion facilitator family transporter, partial [Mariprofundaceae bacterium]|nr:cation diffusion facilitator family transporter [Mariprofundaceae bacterium]